MIDHVTNKNLSIKLKEAGFEQVSKFYWVKPSKKLPYYLGLYSGGNEIIFDNKDGHLFSFGYVQINGIAIKQYSAYLATELLKWLPNWLYYKEKSCSLSICKNQVAYRLENGFAILLFKGNTLQDALGEMLLYLKKEGLI